MQESKTLENYLSKLFFLRLFSKTLFLCSHTGRSLLLAYLAKTIWTNSEQTTYSLPIFFLSFLFFMLLDFPKRSKKISLEALKLSVNIQNTKNQKNLELHKSLDQHSKNQVYFENQRLTAVFSSFFFIICLYGLSSLSYSNEISVLGFVKNIAQINKAPYLSILKGLPNKSESKKTALSSSKALEYELIDPNLIQVEWESLQEKAPIIQLKALNSETKEVFQSFQMYKSEKKANTYSASFSIDQSVELHMKDISNKALVIFNIKSLPIPIVKLSTKINTDLAWADDQSLKLNISALGHQPLQLINLIIRIDNKEYKELVNTISNDELYEYSAQYPLVLEPFMTQDISNVEITAEAIDKSTPQALIGRSNTLRFQVASSYGRYKQTLGSLHELKKNLDRAIETQESKLSQQANDLAQKAYSQSKRSPYFDALDRIQIADLVKSIQSLHKKQSLEQLIKSSDNLNKFLSEHEMLDDRERDRDFFVAARSLSRSLEQQKNERKAEVNDMVTRTNKFLDERQTRWKLRVERLRDQAILTSWQNIQQKHFQKQLNKIGQFDEKAQSKKALSLLSQTTDEYRTWIENLEQAEDKKREQADTERQKGLANAREKLNEIRKRQGQISSKLDNSEQKSLQDLQDSWPVARMDENLNIKESKRLAGQIRNLSPAAANRIQAASEAMEYALEQGNAEQFVSAESYADFAGRLLRKAEKDTRNSQKKGRQRKRRRITGNHYYGQTIHNGDIEIDREYKVDAQYRESILNEVYETDSPAGEQNSLLLNDYLRRIVR